MSYIRQHSQPPRPVTADNIAGMKLPTDLTGLLTWHVLALCAALLLGIVIGRLSAAGKLTDARAMVQVCATVMPQIVEDVYGAAVRSPREPRLRPWLRNIPARIKKALINGATARIRAALARVPAPKPPRVETVPAGDPKAATRDRFTVPRQLFPNLHAHMSRERLLTTPREPLTPALPATPELPRFHDRIFVLDLTGAKPRGHLIPA